MGKCESHIRQVRFVIEDELTHCYVAVEAIGDCPLGVQGWHYKAFGKSQSAVDILQGDFKNHVLWPQEAPPDRG
jgi:hypothetical protein